jgi:hypothetical protein
MIPLSASLQTYTILDSGQADFIARLFRGFIGEVKHLRRRYIAGVSKGSQPDSYFICFQRLQVAERNSERS